MAAHGWARLGFIQVFNTVSLLSAAEREGDRTLQRVARTSLGLKAESIIHGRSSECNLVYRNGPL
jgi:hypothetical protein